MWMILSVHCWAAEKNNDERLPQTVEQDEATQQETEESETKIWRLLEMTEREKMLSGELYDPTDKELEQLRLNARKLARKYNLTDEDQPEEQAQILQELLPTTEELPYLQAPVYFDYGCNTFLGKLSFANFNFTGLDVCEIHIGDNVMIIL